MTAARNLRRAKEPFQFFSRLSLTAATGVTAADLRELLAGIRSVPDSVIYTHTHRFVQQFQFLAPEPTNDFAVWAVEALQAEQAGEKLTAIDTVRYSAIGDLRGALVSVLEQHLERYPVTRSAAPGREFQFMRTIRFSLPTPYEAWDLAEFRDSLKRASVTSLYLHLFESNLRPPLGVNDFSAWFDQELGEKTIAKEVADLNPYSQPHEKLRDSILEIVERRLEALDRA